MHNIYDYRYKINEYLRILQDLCKIYLTLNIIVCIFYLWKATEECHSNKKPQVAA